MARIPFVFRALKGDDEIRDYNPASDTILLDHAKFAALLMGPLAETQFKIAPAATDSDDQSSIMMVSSFMMTTVTVLMGRCNSRRLSRTTC